MQGTVQSFSVSSTRILFLWILSRFSQIRNCTKWHMHCGIFVTVQSVSQIRNCTKWHSKDCLYLCSKRYLVDGSVP